MLHTLDELTVTWYAAITVMVTIIVTTVMGNTAVLLALKHARRTPTHYPLASLAAADLLIGTCVLPLAAARELFLFHFNATLCACWSTLDVLSCTASILSLCVLGWERWRGITAPLARVQRAKRARLLACLIWPMALIIALPTAIVPSQQHLREDKVAKACSVNTNIVYVIVSGIFSFYIPASLMMFLYIRILNALSTPATIRSHRGRTLAPSPAKRAQETRTSQISKSVYSTPVPSKHHKLQKLTVSFTTKHKAVPGPTNVGRISSSLRDSGSPAAVIPRQRRATRTIVTLMLLFLVCWTPFFVMLPIDSLCNCVWESMWLLCSWLGYANSAFNPLVYAVASPSVRGALRSLTLSSSGKTTNIPMMPSVRRKCKLPH